MAGDPAAGPSPQHHLLPLPLLAPDAAPAAPSACAGDGGGGAAAAGDEPPLASLAAGRGRRRSTVGDPTVPGNIRSDSARHLLKLDELDRLFEEPAGLEEAGAGAAAAAGSAGGAGTSAAGAAR